MLFFCKKHTYNTLININRYKQTFERLTTYFKAKINQLNVRIIM